MSRSRLAPVLCLVGGLGVIGSLYANWYEAASSETFCGYVTETLGGMVYPGEVCAGDEGAILVDMWFFTAPSLIALGFGLLSLWAAYLGTLPESRLAALRYLVAGSVALAPVFVGYRMLTPPGYTDLFEPRYGAWLGLAFATVAAVGAVGVVLPAPHRSATR